MGAETGLSPVMPGHAAQLASTMRPEDAAEVLAADGHTPAQALEWALSKSTLALSMLLHGEVAAIVGFGPMESGDMCLWMLSGTAVEKDKAAFKAMCKPTLELLLEQHPVFLGAVDARYEKSVRWLRWLGAEVGEPKPYGPSGQLFHPVVFRRPAWAAS